MLSLQLADELAKLFVFSFHSVFGASLSARSDLHCRSIVCKLASDKRGRFDFSTVSVSMDAVPSMMERWSTLLTALRTGSEI